MDKFKFLEGHWTAQTSDGPYEEVWLAPTSNAMQGTARQMQGGRTVFMEFFSLEFTEKEASLYMMLGAPSAGPKTPKRFNLVKSESGSVTFEMKKNDFPRQIRYTAKGKDGLECLLTGVQSGKPAEMKYVYRRKG